MNRSTSFCLAPAPKETYACVYGGTGLVRCGGTSPAKSGCANNAASAPHEVVLDESGVGGKTPNTGGSALSIYANGSGREGPVSKGSVNANGELWGAADMAESKFDGLNDAGVVARVDQGVPEAEEGGLVPLPLPECVTTLEEESSGCDVSDPPTGGRVVTVAALSSRPTPRRLIGRRRGSSPSSSGGSGVPCKKLATAADAVLYNHAIGKSLGLGAVCSDLAS